MKTPRPWIDASLSLVNGMAYWPGNPPFRTQRVKDLKRGDHSNVSLLSLGSHTGTHMDAPVHFLKGGKGIDAMPYEASNGPARVLWIPGRGEISADALERHRIRRGERLLLKTANSTRLAKRRRFTKDFVHLSTQACELLARRGVRCVGVDYLSVGGYHTNGGEVHRLLLGAGIWIIEGLDLSRVSSGRHELACLPLKIAGGDGAPARALLRKR